jgi:hypothetical protein
MIGMMDEHPKRIMREKHTENLQLSAGEETQIYLDTFLFWSNLDIFMEECRSIGRKGKEEDLCLNRVVDLSSVREECIKPNTEELSLC